MKLTKQLEKEILKVYNDYWRGYMNGDMKAFAFFLDDDVKVIGSTEAEVFYNKKEALRFYKPTADQIKGKAELRNRIIKAELAGNLILITEQSDFYILIEDKWTFYAKGRLSTFFHNKNDSWKVIQQHGSMPDIRAMEGEQFALEKISKENIELRDAVKRRTVELENKNRELEIETALEKVRAIAMGMKKPADMLDVCKTISVQLRSLGVNEIRNVQTAIFYESRGTYMNYEYYARHRKTVITETSYTNHKIHKDFAAKMLKGKGEFFSTHIKGKKVKDWIAYQKTTNVFIDRFLEKAISLNYYWHSLGPVALGFSSYTPLNDEELNLFKRFLSVFELAYRRYMDIEHAMAQAKEAQIEASLERVRTQAMSMRKSDELAGVGKIIFTELKSLGFADIRNTEIIINNDTKNSITSYYFSDYGVTGTIEVDYTTHPTVNNWMEDLKKTSDSFAAVHIPKKQMKEWRKYRESLGYKPDRKLNKVKTVEYYSYSIGLGALSVSSFKPIAEEQLKTLERFKNVFGLAYRRYADVAMAEAQANEAKIELGLERVRARAMAMQNSDELAELVSVLFKELTRLDFSLTSCIIWISDTQTLANTLWVTSAEMNKSAEPVRLKPFHHSFFHSIIHAWKEKDSKWIYTLTGKEKTSFEKTFFADEPEMPVALKKALSVPKKVVFSASFNNFGALEILGTEPLTEEKFEILHRFGKVFDSSYTRFNDLKKAEAQAREAQIELALERVRARAMAMQNSDELSGLVATLFEELTKLDLILYRCIIWIFNPDTMAARIWMANSEDKENAESYFIKKLDHPYYNSILKAWKEKKTKWVYELQGKDKKSIDKLLLNETELAHLPDAVKTGILSSKHTIISGSFNNFGLIEASGPVQQSEEQLEILSRFGKVFDSSYTRFNDLKKAEAQTREAQIEVAMERIRARAMAMHSSAELREVANVLRKQMALLDQPELETSAVLIYDDALESWDSWYAFRPTSDAGGRIKNGTASFTKNSCELTREIVAMYRSSATDYTLEISGAKRDEWLEVLTKEAPEVAENAINTETVVFDTTYFHFSDFNGGSLLTVSYLPPSEEIKSLQRRAASVFDLAYRRFLDLQNAEAQTREAQIEVAVERVRAKALAMHKSDEIMNVVVTMRTELESLNIPGFSAATFTLRQDDGTIRLSDNTSAKQYENGLWENTDIIFRLEKNNPEFYINRIWNSNEKYFVAEQDENDLLITIDWIKQFDRALADVIENYFKENEIKHAWHPAVQLTHGWLNLDFYNAPEPEMETILLKMGAAFDLAYKRFLDLQKAEAQTREAKIEAALERTRTQSMIMQHSKELDDTLRVFHEQVLLLGINSAFSYLWLPDEKNDRHIFWAAWKENGNDSAVFKSKAINYPLDRNEPATAQCLIDWKSNEPVYSYYVLPAAVENYFAVWQELIDGVEHLKPEHFSDGLHYVEAFMKYGCFGVIVTTDLTEDEKKILSRFANEFERTYTRFLDLQKAEAQAREAEIQLALERVRARSLAMHHTSELQDIVNIVAQQLYHIGMDINGGVLITINDEVDEYLPLWASSGAADYVQKVVVPFFDRPIFTDLRDAIKRRNNFFANEYGKEEKDEMFVHLFRYAPWSSSPEERKKELLSRKGGLTRSAAISQYTSIAITNHNGKKFSEEEHEILKRFGNVFEQSYTRFLDLQKAEAQAREAQIEAGLERVRSRSLAMHNTSELQEVIHTAHKELLNLNIAIHGGSFIAINSDINTELRCWGSGGTADTSEEMHLPLYKKPFCTNLINGIKNGPGFFTEEYTQQEKKDFFTFLFKHEPWSKLDVNRKKETLSSPGGYTRSCFVSQHTSIFIINHFGEKFSAADNDILQRFGKVFEQTYTRFLDLQKAEAQAREAEIELALERVRSRAMAMHSSQELKDVATELRNQMNALGQTDMEICAIHLYDESPDYFESIAAGPVFDPMLKAIQVQVQVKLPKQGIQIIEEMMNQYHSGKKDYVLVNHGKKGVEWFELLKEKVPLAYEFVIQNLKETSLEDLIYYWSISDFKGGSLVMTTYVPPADEVRKILRRFANVFGLAYQRFKDLKKAEEQAKEAQTETALERVRSRTMAMQHSAELGEVAAELFNQMNNLVTNLWTCGFVLCENNRDEDEWWLSMDTGFTRGFFLPNVDDYAHSTLYKGWMEGDAFRAVQLEGKDLQQHYDWLMDLPIARSIFEEMENAGLQRPDWQKLHAAYFSKGYLVLITREPCGEEEIFKRFAQVFDQTYTRFLDLQKAEAQAREAEIELALERVRARTLAMQKSQELKEVIQVVYEQFVHLNIKVEHSGFVIDYKERDDYNIWVADPLGVPSQVIIPYFDSVYYNRFNEAKEKGEDFFATNLSFEEKNKFYQKLFEYVPGLSEEAKNFYFSCTGLAASTVLLENVCLYIENFSGIPYTDEENNTLMRFGKVFQQTYTRFNDLQKAEAQAREAQIEAALEKVRGRAMAIRKSDELGEVIQIIFQEMNKLGIDLMECSIATYDTDPKNLIFWSAGPFGSAQPSSTKLQYIDHPLLIELLKDFESGIQYRSGEYSGDLLKTWWDRIFIETDFKYAPKDFIESWKKIKQVFYSQAAMNHGFLEFLGIAPLSDDKVQILKRFTNVIDLTYTRYDDVVKAEAQAREAQIETALERVRSRTMAMQKSEELPEAANVLFLQVQSLGIPAWSCGYNILAEDKKSSTCIMSSEGEIQVPFVLPLTEHSSLLPWYEAIQNNLDFFVYGQGGKDLIEHYNYLATVPGLEEVFQQFDNAGISLPANQINHLVRFTNGFLLFITYESVPDAHDIFKRFGKVFEQTYTRFLDLQLKEEQALRLREEKTKLEQTLGELQTTQKQLIQSEKMASLGELTAGIAHEIQNPLNFVNNFSEVSNELLQEMMEEVEKGNYDLAKEIAEDVKQNLEKINNHGKRADAIVKGMLQHSRSSAGTKEPTDINALCDEYLRLSYHGLRAKDKSFNAKFETDFDPTVGKINVMPQDIGRVILNLINNAFYAASLPSKGGFSDSDKNFNPCIWISTKKIGDEVLISVRDNGQGIPQKILDKIFQPFFTTKPTGQGTGLGLSLAYDIIKAHGGEIKVETKEREGTAFIILLPS